MAAENLYSDFDETTREVPAESDGEDSNEPTALIPKSITGGKTFEPHDEIVLEVVSVRENELEVKYATEKPGEEDSEPEEGGEDESMHEDSSENSYY